MRIIAVLLVVIVVGYIIMLLDIFLLCTWIPFLNPSIKLMLRAAHGRQHCLKQNKKEMWWFIGIAHQTSGAEEVPSPVRIRQLPQ